MSDTLRIAIGQLNFIVGDIDGNIKKMIAAANSARDEQQADIIVFPELSLTGYPPEDLLFRTEFIAAAEAALALVTRKIKDIYCVIGHPFKTPLGIYNSCSLIYNNQILGRYDKQFLPNYGVFDEQRYFIPGNKTCVIKIKNIAVGLTICEDLWNPEPILALAKAGAQIVLSPNASPFEVNKDKLRQAVLVARSQAANLPIVYANCIGGQDEIIFDGGSMVVNSDGVICQQCVFFAEEIKTIAITFPANQAAQLDTEFSFEQSDDAKIYAALVLSVRDYIQKNKFTGVLIGASGGIDSALTLAIATDALGQEHVTAVLMPSRYTQDISMDDAIELANNLNIQHEVISIEPIYSEFLASLAPIFKNKKPDITEENLQARSRGTILMALANKFNKLVLTTGNRSEMAVGYMTLYGDMAGGFAVLKDIPKTQVYRLANFRNNISPVIPARTIERPPTAELAPDQKDEDSLPVYEILDQILALYLNEEKSAAEIIAAGFNAEVVTKVVSLIHRNEYKRRQAPIGPRINQKSFGRDRRYPMTSGFNK
jgi:NAD+ synthase (glutamine-hydrolysing)